MKNFHEMLFNGTILKPHYQRNNEIKSWIFSTIESNPICITLRNNSLLNFSLIMLPRHLDGASSDETEILMRVRILITRKPLLFPFPWAWYVCVFVSAAKALLLKKFALFDLLLCCFWSLWLAIIIAIIMIQLYVCVLSRVCRAIQKDETLSPWTKRNVSDINLKRMMSTRKSCKQLFLSSVVDGGGNVVELFSRIITF